MALTTESGFTSTLSSKLTAAATSLTLATAPTVTAGRLYLRSWSTEEWISYTGVSGTSLTGLTRGLSQTADPASAWTWQTWVAWTIVTLVFMHDQTFDRQSPLPLTFATTAARDTSLWADWAALSSWVNIYVTATWLHYNYSLSSAVWQSIDTWTTTPNSSTTVSGSVETWTSAESIAATDVWWTGANNIVLPSDIAKNTQSGTFEYAVDAGASDTYVISLTPTLTAYTTGQTISFQPNTTNTGASTINIDSLGAKSIKLIDTTDPLDGDLTSGRIYDLKYDGTNFVLQQVPERSTDAEATTWTNTTNYITPKQAKDNYGFLSDIVVTSRGGAEADWTQVISHSLWVVPKLMIFQTAVSGNESLSMGSSDWTLNKCSHKKWAWLWGSSSTKCIVAGDSSITFNEASVTATSTTNITLTWVKTLSPWSTAFTTITLFG